VYVVVVVVVVVNADVVAVVFLDAGRGPLIPAFSPQTRRR